MLRRLFTILSAFSLLLCVAVCVLWVRTEALRRTDSMALGEAGAYRCLEFRGDAAEYKVLRDPGFAPTRLRWVRLRAGVAWARPPPPASPGPLPPGSVTWVMPSPANLDNRQFVTSTGAGATSSSTAAAHGGVPALGFAYARFPGWYGPGTRLDSYRVSYFLALFPASVPPALWLCVFAVRRWRFGRYGPGRCRACGYDLRATPDRCPECGAVPTPATGAIA